MITNGYVTLNEAKARLWPTGAATDAGEDAMIENIIEAASRQVDTDTGRYFYTNAADETRTYQAQWFDCVWTDDIISITTLKTDDDADGTFETTWAVTDYALTPLNAALNGKPYQKVQVKLNGDHTFPVGEYAGVQIVGKFGWSTPPKGIKEATLTRCLIDYWTKNAFGGSGQPRQTLADLEQTYAKQIAGFMRLAP